MSLKSQGILRTRETPMAEHRLQRRGFQMPAAASENHGNSQDSEEGTLSSIYTLSDRNSNS